jgi:hypothetical protein
VGHSQIQAVGLLDEVGNMLSDGLDVGTPVGLGVVGLVVVGLAVGTLVGADVVTVASEQSVARYHIDPLLGVIFFALFTIASRT